MSIPSGDQPNSAREDDIFNILSTNTPSQSGIPISFSIDTDCKNLCTYSSSFCTLFLYQTAECEAVLANPLHLWLYECLIPFPLVYFAGPLLATHCIQLRLRKNSAKPKLQTGFVNIYAWRLIWYQLPY